MAELFGGTDILSALGLAEKAKEGVYADISGWEGEQLLSTSYGLTVLPGSEREKQVDIEKAASFIGGFTSTFEVVVLDLGHLRKPGISGIAKTISLEKVILVTEPSQRCMIKRELIPDNFILVVNRKGVYHPRDMARFYGVDSWFEIPDDPKAVKKSVTHREPLVSCGKKIEAGMKKIVLAVLGETVPQGRVEHIISRFKRGTLASTEEMSETESVSGAETETIKTTNADFPIPDDFPVYGPGGCRTIDELIAANPTAAIVPADIPDLTGAIKALRRDFRLAAVPIIVQGRCDTGCCYQVGADECVDVLDAAAVERVRARAAKMREMWDKAARDNLTGLYNREFLLQYLAFQERRYRETGVPFSLLMADLDHFKRVNDTHGHDAGDAVLKQFAGFLAGGVRQVDLAARYGGEEFIVVFPSLEDAREIAERLCRGWAGHRIKLPAGQGISSTFSGGLAVMGRDAENAGELIKAADQAMYRAKGAGRNRVVAVGVEEPPVQQLLRQEQPAASKQKPQNKPKEAPPRSIETKRVPKVVTVWSPLPTGKTFVAANFAAVLTWKGYSVILVTSHNEIIWYKAKPVPLDRALNNPAQAWKLGGQCEEVTGVMLISGNIESTEDLIKLPCDVIIVDGNLNMADPDLMLEVINSGSKGNIKPLERRNAITVLNRTNGPAGDGDLIAIPERPVEAARGMKRGIPPVIYSKDLAEVFIKLEIAAGL
ncbi:hypothetical protein A6M21_07640 [Desulfotomaculum copahuensis]|uniref:GGDEF domain-containing protein n=1 Tax=Desulfotomaculum copahuensis TaxID=1838280 RepID=A0A1B7LG26_9FIRM|nr:hypothetical protein A6M21_07640 [Desulfotomaculum copahuensis]